MSLAKIYSLKRQLNKVLATNTEKTMWFGTRDQLDNLSPPMRQGYKFVFVIDLSD